MDVGARVGVGVGVSVDVAAGESVASSLHAVMAAASSRIAKSCVVRCQMKLERGPEIRCTLRVRHIRAIFGSLRAGPTSCRGLISNPTQNHPSDPGGIVSQKGGLATLCSVVCMSLCYTPAKLTAWRPLQDDYREAGRSGYRTVDWHRPADCGRWRRHTKRPCRCARQR